MHPKTREYLQHEGDVLAGDMAEVAYLSEDPHEKFGLWAKLTMTYTVAQEKFLREYVSDKLHLTL